VKYTGSTFSAAARVASSRLDRAEAWNTTAPRDNREEACDSIRERKSTCVATVDKSQVLREGGKRGA
jgi:hypothetical protein